MNETKCSVCGRRLKNPKYVAMGVGPSCAKKIGLHTMERDPSMPYVASKMNGKVWSDTSRFGAENIREAYSLAQLSIDPVEQPLVAKSVADVLRKERSFTNKQGIRIAWIDMGQSQR